MATTSHALEKHQSGAIITLSENGNVDRTEIISPEIKMWCRGVKDFSSQYGNELSISYTMSNLEGASNVYSQYGDFTQAAVMRTYGKWWRKCPSATKNFLRSRGSFISQDFVELSFECSVLPTKVEIFETYNPGSVVRILACDRSRQTHTRWHVLWEGLPQAPPQAARIFTPQPIRKCPFYTSNIRIEFHHSELSYYAELDAIRLTGHLPSNGISVKGAKGCSAPFPWQMNSLNSTLTSSIVSNRDVSNSSSTDFDINFSSYNLQLENGSGGFDGDDDDDDEEEEEEDGFGTSVDVPMATQMAVEIPDICNSPSHDGWMEEDESFVGNYHKGSSCAFFRLPTEILKIIFDYLDLRTLSNLSLTCRFFYRHCNDETQFYELDLQPYWHLITDNVLSSMLQKFKRLRKVDLSWCCGLSNSGVLSFLNEPHLLLTCLRLNCCPFVDCYVLEKISSHCPNLKELRLQSCQKAIASSFSCLASLKELKILDLYRTLVNTESIVKIVRSCQKLEQINLGSCTNNTDCNRVAMEMARNCPNLKSVDLWRSRGLTFVGLSSLVRGCNQLEELDLGWCNQLKSSDGCFREVAENCSNLKKLFATANRGLCNDDLDIISQNCQQLEQLDVLGTREITNKSILRLLVRCQSLELLDLSFCMGVDYHGLESTLVARPRVDVKRSFQGSTDIEDYLDWPAQFQ